MSRPRKVIMVLVLRLFVTNLILNEMSCPIHLRSDCFLESQESPISDPVYEIMVRSTAYV